MKIGILTFHASHNYGSMLQAYALQKVLSSWGYDGEIINYRSDSQKYLYMPELEWRHPKDSVKKILSHPWSSFDLQRKYNRFELFLQKNLKCSRELHDHQEIEDYLRNSKIDTCIVGSDQVWNPNCFDFGSSYLLDFALPIKRIAYAPSLGSAPESLPKEKKELLKQNWLCFDYLSTREQRGSTYVSQVTGRECSVVLDPTLLLTKEDYSELLSFKVKLPKEPYIFYYTPREESGTFAAAQRIAHEMGLKIVVTQTHSEYSGNNIIRLNDCGPREFLQILNHASFCIGKSFHLMVFSLLFEKNFLMLSRDKDSRIMTILESLNLSDFLIAPIFTHLTNITRYKIDYSHVRPVLKELRNESCRYLKRSLT